MHGKNHILDFMTSGNIIGEMGLLTSKPRSATVVCETSVQVIIKNIFSRVQLKYMSLEM